MAPYGSTSGKSLAEAAKRYEEWRANKTRQKITELVDTKKEASPEA
jgi:hypothetical protein